MFAVINGFEIGCKRILSK